MLALAVRLPPEGCIELGLHLKLRQAARWHTHGHARRAYHARWARPVAMTRHAFHALQTLQARPSCTNHALCSEFELFSCTSAKPLRVSKSYSGCSDVP